MTAIAIVATWYTATYGGWVPALIAPAAWLVAGICWSFAKRVAKFFIKAWGWG